MHIVWRAVTPLAMSRGISSPVGSVAFLLMVFFCFPFNRVRKQPGRCQKLGSQVARIRFVFKEGILAASERASPCCYYGQAVA